MSSRKIITFTLLAALVFVQVGTVLAAPALQDGSITGTVTALACGTDSEGNTIILVTLEDAEGASQTVSIDLVTADNLGLVTIGENDLPDCSAEAFTAILDAAAEEGLVVTIDLEDESAHPISVVLAAFFDVDASVIDGYHEGGFGFGVIAQSLWMSQNMSGDASLTADILEAKQDKDFESFFENHPEYLAEDEAVPTNWGQFKKSVSDKKNNLGSVISGQAGGDDTPVEEAIQPGNGNGNSHKDTDKEKNKDNNGKGKGSNK